MQTFDRRHPFGYCPFADEPDQRLLPDGNQVAGAIADIFDALISTLEDTRLEPDLDDLLWSTVNVFPRATGRITRELDDNERTGTALKVKAMADGGAAAPFSISLQGFGPPSTAWRTVALRSLATRRMGI